MKKLIFLSLFLFISTISFTQDKKPQCKNFYTGIFFTKDNHDKDTIVYVREKNYQTEHIIKNGKVFKQLKVKIIWVNDCTYILRNVKHPNNSSKFIVGDIKCKIIQTGDDFFIVKAKQKGGKWMSIKFHVYKEKFTPNED